MLNQRFLEANIVKELPKTHNSCCWNDKDHLVKVKQQR